jgi:release factor glutamine methyltransferase
MEENSKTVWTPLKIIQWAVPYLSEKGVPNARFDAESLVAHALKMDRLKVYLQFDRPLDPPELSLIRESLKRRAQHEPIQYITGQREFFGFPFKVDSSVLIPRPETEQLVEKAIEFLEKIPEENREVLDLGTGSGCIAISLAKSISCRVWATDLSEAALKTAVENAKNLGAGGAIQWRQGDWFAALNGTDPQKFQVILSNPPYIALEERAELAREIRDYEPSGALFGGDSGLVAYEKLAKTLAERVVSGGLVLLELHSNGYEKVLSLFKGSVWTETLYRDLQGHPRVLSLKKSTID